MAEMGPKPGWAQIRDERHRHPTKGYDAAHDRHHDQGELVDAALAYIRLVHHSASETPGSSAQRAYWDHWPWQGGFQPADDPVANLVEAGAFIAAEIDRIQDERRREGR